MTELFPWFHKETPKQPEVLEPETWKISDKLTVTTVPLEYYPKDTIEKYGEQISEAIQNSDGVIMEYFPDEIKKLDSNAYAKHWTNYKLFMPYQEFVASKAAQHGKDVFVIDPAHDANFGAIRIAPMVGFVGGVGLFIGSGRESIIPKVKTPARLRLGMFLSGVSSIAATGIMAEGRRNEMLSHKFSKIPTEASFRRIIIAQGLNQMGKTMDTDPTQTEKNLVLFYPPAHTDGIKYYRSKPEFQKLAFGISQGLKAIPAFKDSFFTIRTYQHENGQWHKKESIEIK